jgi:hypothetical protein
MQQWPVDAWQAAAALQICSGQFALVRCLGPCLAVRPWLCGICLLLIRSKFAFPFDKKKTGEEKNYLLGGCSDCSLKTTQRYIGGISVIMLGAGGAPNCFLTCLIAIIKPLPQLLIMVPIPRTLNEHLYSAWHVAPWSGPHHKKLAFLSADFHHQKLAKFCHILPNL